MITKLGETFTDLFKRVMPDAFVFALILTLITALGAWLWMDSSPLEITQSWYQGFWNLLEFGMQMVLLIVTGYSIALASPVAKGMDRLAKLFTSPRQVYFAVVLIGFIFSMISWGWVVITAVLARQLALRIPGINYAYLVACVYFSMISWVAGFSSSIPLLLNTADNYLIQDEILSSTIPTTLTLGSSLNWVMIPMLLIVGPLLLVLLAPKHQEVADIHSLLPDESGSEIPDIRSEAEMTRLPFKATSDRLNHSMLLQYIIALMGFGYIIYYFMERGADLNLNIMIFIFLMLGLLMHRTPMRYAISMKHASSNVSGIIFQYPFYAGIMGIMTYTGMGEALGELLASVATLENYPFFAYLLGGVVNFAIPSAGGEYAVIGPSVIEAVNTIGAGLPAAEITAMHARASMAIAYGEALTNLLQPFFLLLVLPVMAKGMHLQARDVMGYLVLPFLIFFILQVVLVLFVPL